MSNIQVAVRARPLSQRDLDMGSKISVEMRKKATIIFKTVNGVAVGEKRDDSKQFEYDHSYWSVDAQDPHFTTQEQVYNDLGKSVLESAFQGYNACVFAYGQTGSGKTHTMMGTEENPGLIPRICENLYAHIANGSKKNVSYRVEASYMEIYNEKVRDLLQLPGGGDKAQQLHKLKVREHPKDGPYVEDLSQHNVSNFQQISRLMKIGNSHRVTASTKMNDVSSRSHAIFTILFTQAAYSSDIPCETVSKIHLVDLAGSERASATGAEGVRLKEGGNINRSLACLGNVISALADKSSKSSSPKVGEKKVFIPYRDSVLTWLLKDSLGGNSKTIMVATISPSEANYGESLSTLRYASRAKNIVNKPVVNEDANVKIIRELRTEIKRLKSIITAAKLQDSDLIRTESALEENIQKKEEMIAELTKNWAGKWDQGIQQIVEERNLALHSEGIKMTLASERPHLLAVDTDIYSGGIIIYHLKNGATTIGAGETTPTPDIALTDDAIRPEHCTLENDGETVRLLLADGQCFVNHSEVKEDMDLTHGDLLQLGDATVFRFNHPEEAHRMKLRESIPRSALLPLSPISPTISDDSHGRSGELEEQKEALEKDYTERMERLREKLEQERAQDRAKYLGEIEALRQQSLYTPTSDCPDDSDSDPRRSSTYDLLQSVACSPPSSRQYDIAERVVVGREEPQSPECVSGSYQSSFLSSTPGSSPEGVFRRTTIEEKPVDAETVDINIVEKDEKHLYRLQDNQGDGYCMVTAIGDGQEDVVKGCGHDRDDDSGTEDDLTCDLQLRAAVLKLRENDIKYEEAEKQKTDAESKLSEAHRQANSLKRHLHEQKAHHQSEQEEWERKCESLENELITKELSSSVRSSVRSRANAFGEQNSPGRGRAAFRRRSHSSHSLRHQTSTRFKVEVPGCLLRGEGWSSYHVYEVRIQLQGEKWSLYKSYAQFKVFYEDVHKRYSQLSVLSFPPSKWIGVKSREFVERRRMELQAFLQSLIAICSSLAVCPLYDINSRRMTKDKLCAFSSFFDSGSRTGL